MVKELETRCETTEKEIIDIKSVIANLCDKVDEQQKMTTRIQMMLEGFMAEIIGGQMSTLSQIGELSMLKNKKIEEVAGVVPANDVGSDRNKFKKVEMSVFSGIDTDSWLFVQRGTSRYIN